MVLTAVFNFFSPGAWARCCSIYTKYFHLFFSHPLPLSTWNDDFFHRKEWQRCAWAGVYPNKYTNRSSLSYSGCMFWRYRRPVRNPPAPQALSLYFKLNPRVISSQVRHGRKDTLFLGIASWTVMNRIPTLSSSLVCWRKTILRSSLCIIR